MGFRVITLNLWGGRLHDALMPWLKRTQADVFCFQEVAHTPDARSGWVDYMHEGRLLPQRAHLLDELREALPGHLCLFAPSLRGMLLDGERQVPSTWGMATFVRNDHLVIGHAADFVHGDHAGEGWGDYPRPSNALAVRIAPNGGLPPLTVAQMHGLRDLSGKSDTPARLVQAERLAALVERVRRRGEGLIVCGDFNVQPDSGTFGRLAQLGLRDLVTGRGFSDTRTSHYKKPGRYADYMLVNEAVRVEAFDVIAEPEVSDHRPLVLDIA